MPWQNVLFFFADRVLHDSWPTLLCQVGVLFFQWNTLSTHKLFDMMINVMLSTRHTQHGNEGAQRMSCAESLCRVARYTPTTSGSHPLNTA